MSVFKSSNHTPNLQEIDITKENTFSCQVNTSGESIKAYKIYTLSSTISNFDKVSPFLTYIFG